VADRYAQSRDYHPAHDDDYMAWEGKMFGLSSCEVAAMVLAEWRFPGSIVEGVRNQYLLRSADLSHPLACLVNLAGGVAADSGHPLPGETRHWAPTPWKLEAVGLTDHTFRGAITRAHGNYLAFQKRLKGEPAEQVAAKHVAEIRAAPAEAEAAPEPVEADGRMPLDSCNFPEPSGVLSANDEPPVHTNQAGVSQAADFTTFMRNYQDMVFSTAARLTGNDAQAEDISQEVFLKAYENYHHLSTSPTAGGWLKTVATNLSLNHLSRYRNRWRFFSEFKRAEDAEDRDAPEVEFAAPDTFFSGVDAADRRALVEDALAQLPEHYRVPLVLYHFEDMPYEDIAKKLGVSLAKVKTDILRARTALAKILARSGTAHEKPNF
jgi:RNA polymerase sigma-70 factor (ECF subfamily)